MAESPQDVTQLLQAWSAGEPGALDKLAPVVYRELHRLAQRYMAQERPGQTLRATALVNEAYLRLVDVKQVSWQNRAHFFGVSAQCMRRILVERARARRTLKRGSGGPAVTFDEGLLIGPAAGPDLVALDDALKDLTAIDPRRSQVVELRFFGGLTVKETAELLHVSPVTVMNDWKFAKAWLLRELGAGAGGPPGST
jgi:RNA polymerase sigma factor (TIGR02999 family)